MLEGVLFSAAIKKRADVKDFKTLSYKKKVCPENG